MGGAVAATTMLGSQGLVTWSSVSRKGSAKMVSWDHLPGASAFLMPILLQTLRGRR